MERASFRPRTRAAELLCVKAGENTVESAIERLCRDLRAQIQERALPGLGASGPPYEPEKAAFCLGVAECRLGSIREDAILVEEANKLCLIVKREASRQRRRFSIAHEVGHLLIWKACGKRARVPRRAYTARSEIETLCNKIAIEFLAPLEEVRACCRQTSASPGASPIQAWLTTATTFDISLQAAAARVVEAGFRWVFWAMESGSRRFLWKPKHPSWREAASYAAGVSAGVASSGSDTLWLPAGKGVMVRHLWWQRHGDLTLFAGDT